MSSELVAAIGRLDLERETDLGNDTSVAAVLSPGEGNPGGSLQCDLRAVSLPKYVRGNLVSYGYTTAFRVPLNLTVGTGLTFKVYISDDGQQAIDLGTNVQIGITLKRMSANATWSLESGAAAEQTVTITLSSTASGVAIGSLSIANGSLPSGLAAGDLLLMRIRRIGTATQDTCTGRVLLYRVEVNNT